MNVWQAGGGRQVLCCGGPRDGPAPGSILGGHPWAPQEEALLHLFPGYRVQVRRC